jgi:hypothetical protein
MKQHEEMNLGIGDFIQVMWHEGMNKCEVWNV